MGATSVTGVSGAGSVAGIQKGSEHMSLGVAKLIGPKVVGANTVTLSGSGTATVAIPAPVGTTSQYVVMLTSNNSGTTPYISTGLATVANSSDWNFVITGANNAVVNWCLVNVGQISQNIPG